MLGPKLFKELRILFLLRVDIFLVLLQKIINVFVSLGIVLFGIHRIEFVYTMILIQVLVQIIKDKLKALEMM